MLFGKNERRLTSDVDTDERKSELCKLPRKTGAVGAWVPVDHM